VNDDQLLESLQLADPLPAGRPLPYDPGAVLERVLAQPRRSRRRPVATRLRVVALVGLLVAALAVPTAVAFHSQLTGLFQSSAETPTIEDLRGSWTTILTGLKPASLNGRWTVTFTPNRIQRFGFRGVYALTHNRRLVAEGTLGFNYSSVGAMLNLRDMNGPDQCAETIIAGNYTFHLQGKTITFEHFEDQCRKRRAVLANHTFRHR
jgi:hypothetical protein